MFSKISEKTKLFVSWLVSLAQYLPIESALIHARKMFYLGKLRYWLGRWNLIFSAWFTRFAGSIGQAFNSPRARRAVASSDVSGWVIVIFVALILFAIALTIAAPLINGLTTGATPTIAPTSTTGTLVGYIILFVVLGFLLAILAGALYLYSHHGGTK